MPRQHATPVLISSNGLSALPLVPLALGADGHGWSEATVQALIQSQPRCLPIAEIDPLFCNPVPICTELNTTAGSIDNFMVTASGLPVLVECKLWRNPQARREVVGQILDYAKELSRWSSSDLQREVSRRLKRDGNVILELVRAAGHLVDEANFNDALTLNLRRGRFLLIIVGDGIREGVEAIAEYLQGHAGLHFTLGLVELPLYDLPDGSRLVAPRVLTQTLLINREVVTAPEGFVVRDASASDPDEAAASVNEDSYRRDFLLEVVTGLELGDPDQPRPRVTPKGWLFLYMPVPASSAWISVLLKQGGQVVGVRLTSNVNTIGEAAIRRLVQDWDEIKLQLGGVPILEEMSPGRFRVEELLRLNPGPIEDTRRHAVEWLKERLRAYVSIFRPRMRDAVEELKDY